MCLPVQTYNEVGAGKRDRVFPKEAVVEKKDDLGIGSVLVSETHYHTNDLRSHLKQAWSWDHEKFVALITKFAEGRYQKHIQ